MDATDGFARRSQKRETVKRVKEIGAQLAKLRPDIAVLRRAGKTQREIAEKVQECLGEQRFHIEFLRKAVQIAIRLLIPNKEGREAITRARMKKAAGTLTVKELVGNLIFYHSEIAHSYREGSTQLAIAKTLTESFPKIPLEILHEAVQLAIQYLVPTEERKEIAKKHWKARGVESLSGKQGKQGIHKQSLADRQKLGQDTLNNKKGIFSLMPVEIRRRVSKAVGSIMWEGAYKDEDSGMDLGEYCFFLSSEFVYQEGSHKGRPHLEDITAALNDIFEEQLPKPLTKSNIKSYLHRRKHKPAKGNNSVAETS